MAMETDKAHDANRHPILQQYLHPLMLQSLTPERFTATVNKILSGKLKLLIGRLNQHKAPD